MPNALRHLAQNRPADKAISVQDRPWTYQELLTAVDQAAKAFKALGVAPGDRVVLHLANVPELVIAYQACFRVGAIAAPMRASLKGAELQPLLSRLQPSLYVGQASLYANARDTATDVLPLDRRFLVGDGSQDDGARRWDDLLGLAPPDIRLGEPDLDAPAVLLTTSGTTGTPKFVAHSLRTLAATGQAQEGVGLRAGQAVLGNTPLVQAAGLFWMVGCFCLGAELVLVEHFDADAVLDLIERRRVPAMKGTPTMWASLLERQRNRPRNVASLQACSAAGDVCPEALQREFAETFGTALDTTWSSSECAGAFTAGSCGRPIFPAAGSEIRIVDASDAAVAKGETGELLIKGPTLAAGYWDAPGKLTALGPDGWFRTGDMMRQDDGGGLWFMSRKKELLVRGGANVSPVEVERVLAGHPAVLDAVVVGMPDPTWGDRVVALVKLQPGGGGALGEVLARASSQLADFKVPERLVTVDAIPRLPSGKIDRKRAAEIASAEMTKRQG